MTLSERTKAIMDAGAKFYAWEPPGNEFSEHRCYKISSKPCMSEVMCKARARKPEIYQDTCGGRPTCPRWKYYRKLAKQEKGDEYEVVRRAYK